MMFVCFLKCFLCAVDTEKNFETSNDEFFLTRTLVNKVRHHTGLD